MTQQEQITAVAPRIYTLVHEAEIAGRYRAFGGQPQNLLAAIIETGMEPEGCTLDVLRALWSIHEEFDPEAGLATWRGRMTQFSLEQFNELPVWIQIVRRALYAKIMKWETP